MGRKVGLTLWALTNPDQGCGAEGSGSLLSFWDWLAHSSCLSGVLVTRELAGPEAVGITPGSLGCMDDRVTQAKSALEKAFQRGGQQPPSARKSGRRLQHLPTEASCWLMEKGDPRSQLVSGL